MPYLSHSSHGEICSVIIINFRVVSSLSCYSSPQCPAHCSYEYRLKDVESLGYSYLINSYGIHFMLGQYCKESFVSCHLLSYAKFSQRLVSMVTMMVVVSMVTMMVVKCKEFELIIFLCSPIIVV